MKGKLLFVASTRAHICHFHLPYLRQFKQDDWVVHAACGGDKGEIPYTDHVLYLPFQKRMFSYINFRISGILRKKIRRERYTAVIVHTSLAAFFVRLAVLGMKDRPKVINMVHGYLFDDCTPILKRGVLLAAEKLTTPVTDLLITMNRCDEQIAHKHHLGMKICSVPGLGVDFSSLEGCRTGRHESLRTEWNIKPDDFVLIFPAEFSSRKSQHILLRTMTALPANTILLLPGAGDQLASCKKLARKLEIGERVRFPGHTEDISPWYEMADIAVSSSRSEGLPFSVMEAMYFGLPVVASAVKGHMDLIEDGKTGLLYPYGDWLACAQQIKRLMEDTQLAQSISNAAREKAKKYELFCVQPQVMELYRSELNT